MKFTNAEAVEAVVWQLRLADWPRARNRARVNELFNGNPPFSDEEMVQNGTRNNTNVNFLDPLTVAQHSRRQFSQAFGGADALVTVDLDYGPMEKRQQWANIISKQINKIMLGSRPYLDTRDSIFASDVLHGIGPSNWENRYKWNPRALGVEDVLIPSNTLTSLENLPFFGAFRQHTGFELWQATHGPKTDPAWNMPLIERCVSWVDQEAQALISGNWPEVWSPEKMAERVKQDGGLYASDAVPTIDTFDFFYYDDSERQAGWRRRVILDAWGQPGFSGVNASAQPSGSARQNYNKFGEYALPSKTQFLYDSGNRVYAEDINQIIHFQFADCSAVAPFRYHSVRGMGFLLYAVCHLQNRLRCKFNDAIFEALLQYFRVRDPADMERLTKIDLIDKGVIPEGLEFVKAGDRWEVPMELAQAGLSLNRQTISENSAAFVQDVPGEEQDRETATHTMAKVNSSAALVGAMMSKAYTQMNFQYTECARRFAIKNSRDAGVRKFRAACLRQEVPEEALRSERWEVKPVRVVGQGNKILQVAMADKLMALRQFSDPSGQHQIDRLYVLANTDDPALVDKIVPEKKAISGSVHDAQLAAGPLMQGMPVEPPPGINRQEYIETMLHSMAQVIQRINQTGAVGTLMDVVGLQNLSQHIAANIKILAGDKSEAERVRMYQQQLSALQNVVKGFIQRQAQQQKSAAQQSQQNGNGDAASAAAKVQGLKALNDEKLRASQQGHAQKQAQKQLETEARLKYQAQEHAQRLSDEQREHAVKLGREVLTTTHEIGQQRRRMFAEPPADDAPPPD